MSNEIEINQLRERSRDVIINVCNEIGCKNCNLKWDGGCASSDLENKIAELEYPEFNKEIASNERIKR
jgi:hypothetical protein